MVTGEWSYIVYKRDGHHYVCNSTFRHQLEPEEIVKDGIRSFQEAIRMVIDLGNGKPVTEVKPCNRETSWFVEYETWDAGTKVQRYSDEDEAKDAFLKTRSNPNASNVVLYRTDKTYYETGKKL